jgi:predicted NBD/HSP70 family sugar kinase
LEIAASEPSIVTRLQRALAGDGESILTLDANISQIIEAGDNGDEIARTILDDEARVLAIGVAAIVAVLDPPLLILSGGVGAHDELAQLVHRYAAQLIPWMPPIEVSVLGNRAAFYGAIALGLQALRKQVLVETRSRIRLNQITSQP